MTEKQRAMIRDSFAKVTPDAPAVAAMFYQRLFAVDPSLQSLFKGDMNAQGIKLMAMLGTAVANLDRLDAVVPAVRQLGERHLSYGVQDSQYDTVGSALLWTLEQGLGSDFTPALREAWTTCYVTLAGVMKDAAARKTA